MFISVPTPIPITFESLLDAVEQHVTVAREFIGVTRTRLLDTARQFLDQASSWSVLNEEPLPMEEMEATYYPGQYTDLLGVAVDHISAAAIKGESAEMCIKALNSATICLRDAILMQYAGRNEQIRMDSLRIVFEMASQQLSKETEDPVKYAQQMAALHVVRKLTGFVN